MGSHNFEMYIAGFAGDHAGAYESAVQDARDQYGSDPYNGSISTTSGVRLLRRGTVAAAESERIIEAEIEGFSKWGPCGALSVSHDPWRAPDDAEEITEAITLSGKQIAGLGTDPDAGSLHRLLSVPAGRTLLPRSVSIDRLAVDRRVAAKATSGPRVTRYYVAFSDQGGELGPFASQSDARAAAVEALEGRTLPSWQRSLHALTQPPSATVVCRVEREGGAGLAVATTRFSKATVNVSYRVVPAASGTPVHGGWVFFGWAAS